MRRPRAPRVPKPKAPKAVRKVRTFIQASRGGPSPEEKAVFHQVAGVGPSHVTRPFLGLTEAEEEAIADRIAPLIDGVVAQQS